MRFLFVVVNLGLVCVAALDGAARDVIASQSTGDAPNDTLDVAWVARTISALLQNEARMQLQIDSLLTESTAQRRRIDSLAAQNVKQQTEVDKCAQCGHDVADLNGRRRSQQSSMCGAEALEAMLTVCCGSSGHRRGLQAGCSSLPSSCSSQCSMQFVSVYEGCQSTPIMDGLKNEERVAWDTFYSGCKEIEQSTVAMLRPVDVKMFRILVSSAIEAQQGQAEMLGGGQLSTPIVGPLPDLDYPPCIDLL